MPKILDDTPKTLRPYLFHGLDLQWSSGDNRAVCDCPFCDDDGCHYSVKISTGESGCWKCGTGNATTFIRRLWEVSPANKLEPLASHRGVKTQSLLRWGIRRSYLTGEWVIPGWSTQEKIVQLYKYDGKTLWATPAVGVTGTGLFVPEDWQDRDLQFICEGPWDGMVLQEHVDDHPDIDADVVAVPGAMSFSQSWTPLFKGKCVALLYDSDQPQKGQNEGTGITGVKRTAGLLTGVAREIKYLRWGLDGYDPDKPHGYDVRDFLLE